MVQVIFAAGGTGGHLFPALEIAEELSEKGVECLFAAHGLSTSRFFPRDKWKSWDIFASRPSANPWKACTFLWDTGVSTKASCKLLSDIQPSCVIGFGSYHTVPVLAASVLKKVPLFLFEPNASPGRVIRLFSRYATMTGVCFEKTKKLLRGQTELVSMPLLRSNIEPVDKKEALHRYGFSGEAPVVVAFGGSQGSHVINHMVIQALHLFDRQKRPNLLLLCGPTQEKESLEKMAQQLHIMAKVVPFEKEMSYAYAAGDLFVCRSGASTIAELSAVHKPAICIPYPYAKDDHQRTNAEELVKSGHAVLIEEEELIPEKLCTALFRLLHMKATGSQMVQANKKQFSQLLYQWIQQQ